MYRMLVIVFICIASIIMIGVGLKLQNDDDGTKAESYAAISLIIFSVFAILAFIAIFFCLFDMNI